MFVYICKMIGYDTDRWKKRGGGGERIEDKTREKTIQTTPSHVCGFGFLMLEVGHGHPGHGHGRRDDDDDDEFCASCGCW